VREKSYREKGVFRLFSIAVGAGIVFVLAVFVFMVFVAWLVYLAKTGSLLVREEGDSLVPIISLGAAHLLASYLLANMIFSSLLSTFFALLCTP